MQLQPAQQLPVTHAVVIRARDEARRAAHSWVGCDHALVALTSADSLASRALKAVGCTTAVAREALASCEALHVNPAKDELVTHMTLTPRLLCVFERGPLHAVLRTEQFDEHHILLSLLDEIECLPIASSLRQRGVDLTKVDLEQSQRDIETTTPPLS
jgi:ATP-dependent Clp protease ATP-binding subunit ClpA